MAVLSFLPAAVLAVSTLGIAVVQPGPAGRTRVGAVFPFWWSPAETLAAASGAGIVVGSSPGGTVLVLASDVPGLAGRARRAGALLLVDGAGWGPCASPAEGTGDVR